MGVFMEITKVPWRGSTGLFLWAPYSKMFENQGFGKLKTGDLIIHYRTSKAEQYPGMFVGMSRVKGNPKVVKRDEFFEILKSFDLLGSTYQEYFNKILSYSPKKKVYYAELSSFVEFGKKVPYSSLAGVSKRAWKKIRPRQREYLKEIDKEIADIILDLAGQR